MLTLSFTHDFAPEKLSQKRWTERQKHSQENYPVHLLPGFSFQAKKLPPPTESLVRKNLVLKHCTSSRFLLSTTSESTGR